MSAPAPDPTTTPMCAVCGFEPDPGTDEENHDEAHAAFDGAHPPQWWREGDGPPAVEGTDLTWADLMPLGPPLDRDRIEYRR